MRVSQLPKRIDLEEVHTCIPQSTFLKGRPRMVVIKLTNGRNIQIFQNGKIQLLGAISNSVALQMKYELQQKLTPILEKMQILNRQVTISEWKVTNLVVSVDIKHRLKLTNVISSSYDMSYEPEIFPALLIKRLKPIHIAAFHSGKLILTGLKSVSQIPFILEQLLPMLLPYM